MILKKKHLKIEIKNVIDLTFIFLNKKEIFVTKLIFIIYNLYKIDVNNKKFLEKSLFHVSRNIKEFIKELANLVTLSNFITQIRNVYEKNNIL